MILERVTIGRNSVVEGGVVVTRDVPPNCVVAGNQAEVVRRFTKEEIEERKILLNRSKKFGFKLF